jgi:hypothetical protein
MEDTMAERDLWEKLESTSKIVGAVAIPIVLALIGYVVNSYLEGQKELLERDKLNQEMLTQAISIIFLAKEKERLFGNEVSLESRQAYRKHWIETYNSYAKVQLTPDFIAITMEQDTGAADKRVLTTGDKPPPIVKVEAVGAPAVPPGQSQNGDGWVAVGRFKTARYADLNFDILDVPPNAVVDGVIKAETYMRARWSVNLRTNTKNTEDGNSNPVRGLIQAGQCAKVLDSAANIRSQTWAFIDLVTCPPTMTQ